MVDLHRIIQASDRLSILIPGHRQAGTVSCCTPAFAGIELKGGEACVQTKLPGSDLVGGDRVMHTLPRLGKFVGP